MLSARSRRDGCRRESEVARALHEVALATAARAERWILILGQMTAAEKVVAFLLDMVERLSGNSKEEVTLPMSRFEIADYLAISAETVSRSLTELRHRGAISVRQAAGAGAMEKPSGRRGNRAQNSEPILVHRCLGRNRLVALLRRHSGAAKGFV
jgi:hypothetical protein